MRWQCATFFKKETAANGGLTSGKVNWRLESSNPGPSRQNTTIQSARSAEGRIWKIGLVVSVAAHQEPLSTFVQEHRYLMIEEI